MLIVSDVHGATEALRRVAAKGEPLLVLGDLINYIDYRSNDGIVAEVSGRELVDDFVRIRGTEGHEAASDMWHRHWAGREEELRERYRTVTEAAYEDVCDALRGCEAYVTYGNVDRPKMLAGHLPEGARFVDAEVVTISGLRVGFAGGGMASIGTPGEVTEREMAAKLANLGPVDILATHVPPAVPALACDVIGGREKGSTAILEYIERMQPPFQYFGDIHQPRATSWRLGSTRCINTGYFRATGRATRHE
ncbi:MAG: metallophosphoesterase [Actinomycetota bacterium]|nr:metallophosphoesterase [Actinomycetota bacterium]